MAKTNTPFKVKITPFKVKITIEAETAEKLAHDLMYHTNFIGAEFGTIAALYEALEDAGYDGESVGEENE